MCWNGWLSILLFTESMACGGLRIQFWMRAACFGSKIYETAKSKIVFLHRKREKA